MAKSFKIIFLFLFFFLIFTSPVFAAFTITDVTPSEINSADDIFIVSASASALQSNPQYLQLALTAVGNPTNLLGITQNNAGSWYFYKSSPTVPDLESTFYSFNHTDGSWVGQIFGKVDTNDDGYRGPGQYNLRLYKYTISGAGNVSSSYVVWATPIIINISLPSPTPTPTPTLTPTPTPKSTSTPRPTPSPTKSPTAQPASVPSPTGKILATAISTVAAVLGEEATQSGGTISGQETQELEEPEATPPAKQNFLPKILLGGGILTILGMIVSAFLIEKRKRV
jgi:hypothetical protein